MRDENSLKDLEQSSVNSNNFSSINTAVKSSHSRRNAREGHQSSSQSLDYESKRASNVELLELPRRSVKSKIKVWLIELIWNKANLSNFATFLVMVTGVALTLVFERQSTDSEAVDIKVNIAKLIRAFGLFGFSGGMTNWLAIRMMFDKIPFLIGSGILLKHFIEIRENVKKTTMETYFDAGHITSYVQQKTEMILSALQLEESIRDIIRSPEVQQLIEDKIDDMYETPEGMVLGMMVNKTKMKGSIMPSIENIGGDIVPLVSQMIRSSEHLTEDNLREKIDEMITSKLVEMSPDIVIGVVKDMVETELGWVIIWGNIFGGLLGIILEIATLKWK